MTKCFSQDAFLPGLFPRVAGDKRREKKYTTDAGHSIFVLLDDVEVHQCQVQYWAHKMQYNLQVSERVYIGLVNVC